MPVVIVKMTKGRSNDQKRTIIKKITDIISKVAICPKKIVNVIIEDSCTLDDWGLGGKTWTERLATPPEATQEEQGPPTEDDA